MSDLTKNVKDLLGAAVQVDFSIPFNDNQAYDYSANFSQSNFIFGLQSDYTLRTGLVVEAPSNQDIKLFASFKGKLSFFSMDLIGQAIYGLRLSILPSDVLSLHAFLPEQTLPLTDIVYIPVNKEDVKKEIKKILQSQGLPASEIQRRLSDFIKNEDEGIFVNPTDCLGKAEKQVSGSNTNVTIKFNDSAGGFLHPLYLFWLFRNLSNKNLVTFKPKSHKIIQKLDLLNLNLSVNNSGTVLNEPNGPSLGPYRVLC